MCLLHTSSPYCFWLYFLTHVNYIHSSVSALTKSIPVFVGLQAFNQQNKTSIFLCICKANLDQPGMYNLSFEKEQFFVQAAV